MRASTSAASRRAAICPRAKRGSGHGWRAAGSRRWATWSATPRSVSTPWLLVEGARTAVVCAVSYKNAASEGYPAGHRTKIASYACTADYHTTIRAMLAQLFEALRAAYPGLGGRAFTDTAPLAEKQLAAEAGLGWMERQSLLVTPQFGTCVLLGELILTDEANAYDTPFGEERCGTCRRCVEACPTGAIAPDRTIDTARCISCRTIEKVPESDAGLDGWIFGCDCCQSCCPWNLRAPRHRNAAFDPVFDPLTMNAAAWLGMDETTFEALCEASTPLTRSGLARIRENVRRNIVPEEPSER